jgi:hypothetical protein
MVHFHFYLRGFYVVVVIDFPTLNNNNNKSNLMLLGEWHFQRHVQSQVYESNCLLYICCELLNLSLSVWLWCPTNTSGWRMTHLTFHSLPSSHPPLTREPENGWVLFWALRQEHLNHFKTLL